MLLTIQSVRHIAIEQDEVNFIKVDIFTQVFHKRGTLMNIVHHQKRYLFGFRCESSEFVRFATPHISTSSATKGYPIVVTPVDHLLCKNAITIFCIRFQSFYTHSMHAVFKHFSAFKYIIITRARFTIEMINRVGSNFYPRHTRLVGNP